MSLLISFLSGLWFPKILLPLFSIYYFHKFTVNTVLFPKIALYLFLLLLSFLLSYFVFWTDKVIPLSLSAVKSNQLFSLFEFIIFTTFFYWFPFLIKKEIYFKISYIFLIGMLLNSAIYAIYTFFEYPSLLLLRLAMDPFTGSIVNTPGLSNLASLAPVFAIYMLFKEKLNKKLLFINIFIILLALITGVVFQARTFFVILSIGLVGVLIINNYKTSALYIIFFIFTVFFLDLLLVKYSIDYAQYRNSLVLRFSSEGVKSERFAHWTFALNEIQSHPFGGGKVNHAKEVVYWYHNLWLDIARTSGLHTLILFLLYESYIFHSVIFALFKKKKETFIYILLYLLVLIIMFVSIPIEGDLALYFLSIMIGSIILKTTNSTIP